MAYVGLLWFLPQDSQQTDVCHLSWHIMNMKWNSLFSIVHFSFALVHIHSISRHGNAIKLHWFCYLVAVNYGPFLTLILGMVCIIFLWCLFYLFGIWQPLVIFQCMLKHSFNITQKINQSPFHLHRTKLVMQKFKITREWVKDEKILLFWWMTSLKWTRKNTGLTRPQISHTKSYKNMYRCPIYRVIILNLHKKAKMMSVPWCWKKSFNLFLNHHLSHSVPSNRDHPTSLIPQ